MVKRGSAYHLDFNRVREIIILSLLTISLSLILSLPSTMAYETNDFPELFKYDTSKNRNLDTALRLISGEFNNVSVEVTPELLAAIMATLSKEVPGSFLPVEEGGDFGMGEGCSYKVQKKCRGSPYDGGVDYKGRGYIQITHKSNYLRDCGSECVGNSSHQQDLCGCKNQWSCTVDDIEICPQRRALFPEYASRTFASFYDHVTDDGTSDGNDLINLSHGKEYWMVGKRIQGSNDYAKAFNVTASNFVTLFNTYPNKTTQLLNYLNRKTADDTVESDVPTMDYPDSMGGMLLDKDVAWNVTIDVKSLQGKKLIIDLLWYLIQQYFHLSVIDPAGRTYEAGADAWPQSITLENPMDGRWTVVVKSITDEPIPFQVLSHVEDTQNTEDKVGGIDFTSLNLNYISACDPNDIKFIMKGTEANRGSSQIVDLNEATEEATSHFLVGLAIPNHKQFISIDAHCDANAIRMDPELKKTRAGRIMLEADVMIKTEMWYQLHGRDEQFKKDIWDHWFKLLEQSPYYSEIRTAGFNSLPWVTGRLWISPKNVNAQSSGCNLFLNAAEIQVQTEVWSSFILQWHRKIEEYGFRQEIVNDIYARLRLWEDFVRQEWKRNEAYATASLNNDPKYEELRRLFSSLALAQWYKTLPRQNIPYNGLIDSYNISQIEYNPVDLQEIADFDCSFRTTTFTYTHPWLGTTIFDGYFYGGTVLSQIGVDVSSQIPNHIATLITNATTHSFIEENNALYFSVDKNPKQPDLVPGAIGFSSPHPDSNTSFTITVALTNKGELNVTTPFKISFFSNYTYPNGYTQQRFLGEQQVSSVPVEGVVQSSITTSIPLIGNHTIIAVLDYGDSIKELNEINNNIFSPLMVVDPYPMVHLMAPQNGEQYIRDSSVLLEGYGDDAQDGTIDPRFYSWSSDVNGELGNGYRINPYLSEGDHVISLSIQDSEGKTKTEQVHISIVPSFPPVVTVITPLDRHIFTEGETISFESEAIDPEDGTLAGESILWESSIDGVLGAGNSLSLNSLTPGDHTIIVHARDNDGVETRKEVHISVQESTPEVTINTPHNNQEFYHRQATITLEGTAHDPYDGDLSSRLQWSSDREGFIGGGNALVQSLSPGKHSITASVRDRFGLTAVAQVNITIHGPLPPTLSLFSPPNRKTVIHGNEILFKARVHDPETGQLSGNAVTWESSLDGVLGYGSDLILTQLSVGTHTLTVTARDEDHLTTHAEIMLTVQSAPPIVNITSPISGSIQGNDEGVVLSGSAIDYEDEILPDETLVWYIDGKESGHGQTIRVSDLSVGTHVISLNGTDSHGVPGSDSAVISVIGIGENYLNTFSDGFFTKNLTYPLPSSEVVFMRLPTKANITHASVNLEGLPYEVSDSLMTTFTNGKAEENVTFMTNGETITRYFDFDKQSNVTQFSLELTGPNERRRYDYMINPYGDMDFVRVARRGGGSPRGPNFDNGCFQNIYMHMTGAQLGRATCINCCAGSDGYWYYRPVFRFNLSTIPHNADLWEAYLVSTESYNLQSGNTCDAASSVYYYSANDSFTDLPFLQQGGEALWNWPTTGISFPSRPSPGNNETIGWDAASLMVGITELVRNNLKPDDNVMTFKVVSNQEVANWRDCRANIFPSLLIGAELHTHNTSLHVGAQNAAPVWRWVGDFKPEHGVQSVNAPADEINAYLDNCVPNQNNLCIVPIHFSSDTAGRLQYQNLAVTYHNAPRNPSLDIGSDGSKEWTYTGEFSTATTIDISDTLQRYLHDNSVCSPQNTTCDIPLTFTSTKGFLKVSDLDIQYTIADKEPPVIHEIAVTPQPVRRREPLSILVNATDNMNLSQVTLTFLDLVTEAVYNPRLNLYEGSMNAPESGMYPLQVTARDGNNITTQTSVNVEVVSDEVELSVTPEEIMYTPSQPPENTLLTISATIHNFGTTAAEESTVTLLVDGAAVATEMLTIPAQSVRTAQLPWLSTYGTHLVGIRVDALEDSEEENIVNNEAYITITGHDATAPDIHSIAVSPAAANTPLFIAINTTDNVAVASVSATINNQELLFAHNPTTGLYENSFQIPNAGLYDLVVVVEDSNGLVASQQTQARISPTKPDVSITKNDIQFSTLPFLDGETVNISLTVHNNGGTDVPLLTTEFLVDNNRTYNISHRVGAHAVHQVIIPWEMTYGTHTLTFNVDALNTVSDEQDETNNHITYDVAVEDGTPPTLRPDIPQSVYVSESFPIFVSAHDNVGVSKVEAIMDGHIYELYNRGCDPQGCLADHRVDTRSVQLRSVLNAPGIMGEYPVTVVVYDLYGLKSEKQYMVMVRPLEADLAIGVLDVSLSPIDLKEPDIVTINATVHNYGGTDVSDAIVQLRVDNDLERRYVSVPKGSTADVSFVWPSTYGDHPITITLDPQNSLPESNESNNMYTKNLFVQDTIAPAAPALVVDHEGWTKESQHMVSWNPVYDTNGIDHYEYQIDVGPWTSVGLDTSFRTSQLAEGIYTLSVRAVDLPGNVGSEGVARIFIDTSKPQAPVAKEWHTGSTWTSHASPYYAWLNPGDTGSGVVGYVGEFDGSFVHLNDSLVYHVNVTSGNHTFKVSAIDALNYTSDWSEPITVHIDITPPSDTSVISDTHPSNDLWYSTKVPVFMLSAKDDHSGVAGFYYIVDKNTLTEPESINSFWSTNNTLIIRDVGGVLFKENETILHEGLDDGAWFLHAVTMDTVGNKGSSMHYPFNIDTTPPSLVDYAPRDTVSTMQHPLTISAEYLDQLSGVTDLEIVVSLDGKDITAQALINRTALYYTPQVPLSRGTHEVNVSLADAAGNTKNYRWNFSMTDEIALPDHKNTTENATPTFTPPQQIILAPEADSFIMSYRNFADRNFGDYSQIQVYPWNSTYLRRGLIRFNLSSISSSAVISNATVYLHEASTYGSPRTIGFYPLQQPWVESNVTWNRYRGEQRWNNRGGDFDQSPTATAGIDWTGILDWESWDVTRDVTKFVTNRLPNYGWLIKDIQEDNSQAYWYFDSKEVPNNMKPYMIVYVSSPISNDTQNDTDVPRINNPPLLEPVSHQTVQENTTLVIQLRGTDADNDQLQYTTNAGSLLPSPFSFSQETGLFTWTPTFNDSGIYMVTFSVNDGFLSDEEVATITIIDVPRKEFMNDTDVPKVNSSSVQTLKLTARADAFIHRGTPDKNFGKEKFISIYPWGLNSQRGIITFDLTQIPSVAIVHNATLYLHEAKTYGFPRMIALHKVLPKRDWLEDHVTWRYYQTKKPWLQSGGDFENVSSSASMVIWTGKLKWDTWDVTTDAQEFVREPATNYGWIIKDTQEDKSQRYWYFDSKDTSLQNAPFIEIMYSPN